MHLGEISKPIFMIGMPRSGTTVLAEAISLHKDLGWFSNYLNRFPCFPWLAIFDRVTNIPLIGWNLRGKKKQERSIHALIRRCLPYCSEANTIWALHCGEKFLWDYLIAQTASRKEKTRIVDYIKSVLRYQGKNRFFTKFTGPPRIHYLNSIFPNAYYVHVIRDPRAVVASLLKVKFWKDGGGFVRPWWHNGLPDEYLFEWESTGRSSVILAAIQWKRVVELAWEEKDMIPPTKYLEIRYEDFIENPHVVLREAFKKLHLKDSIDAHRYISSIGRLRNMNCKYERYLHAKEIDLVEQTTCKTARRAGYDFGL